MKAFEDLITRGFKKLLIVVSDDFPGIIDAVKFAYLYADQHLCFAHLQENSRKHMTKDDASTFNKELDKIRVSSSDTDRSSLKTNRSDWYFLQKIFITFSVYLTGGQIIFFRQPILAGLLDKKGNPHSLWRLPYKKVVKFILLFYSHLKYTLNKS